MTVLLLLALVPGAGAADPATVTFSSTSTFPVPPASSFTANGGGDGWAVALTPKAVYNVYHHSGQTALACHYQSDGSPCWGAANPSIRVYQQTGDGPAVDFSAAGQPNLYIDQASGKLFLYTVRSSDSAAGVLCIDTKAIDPALNPQFDPTNTNGFNPDGRLAICSSGGFTPLSAPNEAQNGGYNHLGAATQIGSRWYAFNWYSGQPASGTMNKVLCFDLKTFSACANQPYPLPNIGTGTVSVGTPGPSVAAVGSKLIVPLNIGDVDRLACFDTTAADPTNTDQTSCGAGWPIDISQVASGFGSGQGAPFPMLSASGAATGVCLPTGTDPCWNLAGTQVDPLPGMTSAIHRAVVWNGPSVVIGPRVYVPEWNNEVDCYDFSAQANCQLKDSAGTPLFTFPKYVSGSSGLYTVNADPQRPNCLWINSDNGEIANFDAFTGGLCGAGPIRVITDKLVGSSPQCFPSKFTSLTIDDPPASAYTSGNVVFADASGNPLPGAQQIALNNGVADLTSLQLSTDQALPQFLITLTNGEASLKPQSVTVTITWTGTFDPSCATGSTTVVNPPTNNTPPPPPPPPATPNVGVTVTGPAVARVGNNVTFKAVVTNTSNQYTETGAQLKAPVPTGSTLVSVTPSQGICPTSTIINCDLGTIAPGGSATVTVVVTPTGTGTLTFSPTITGDHDTIASDNNASKSTPVEDQGAPPPAPPAPTTPGTVNAISVGTIVVNGQTIPPDTVFTIKAGDSVQLNGTLVFTTIGGAVGTFSNVPFSGSRSLSGYLAQLRAALSGPTASFTVAAPQTAADTTTLTLTGGDFSTCTTPRKLSANKPSTNVVRQLWGKAHGAFTTGGKFSAATIRGTTWGVQDRCDGTLTTAVDDVVTVVDNVLSKTITLNPGQTYLAQPKSFKPPTVQKPSTGKGRKGSKRANTIDSVLASGLVWGGQRFKTPAAFNAWLTKRGSSWKAWAKTHQVLAAALATR